MGNINVTTFANSYNPTISNLLNSTTYFINITSYDRTGNSFTNNTFNFTTTQTIPTVISSSISVTLNYPPNNSIFDSPKSIEFNFTVTSFEAIVNASLWSNFSGTWKINQTLTTITNDTKTNFSKVVINTGNYIWNVESCNNQLNCTFAPSNFTLKMVVLNPTNLTSVLSPNITDLFYPINWTKLNITSFINHTSGNFTWNYTEYNISPYNLSLTSFLFNVSNNGSLSIDVFLKQNQTKEWYNWWCNINGIAIDIIDTYKFLFSLPSNSDKQINCSLDVINISETLVNWSVTVNRAVWDFDWTFNST